MGGIINGILSFILTLSLASGVSNAIETAPQDAVNEFLSGMASCDQQVYQMYVDNEYVNFLVNAKGDEELIKDMDQAIFKNFAYEIEGVASKGDVAVAKVRIKTNDFSKVMDKYDKASYDYILNNLYDDKVTDKKKLNKECFRIYVEQIEKLAKKDPNNEEEIYIPMADDGYGGWQILLTDEIMESLMGHLEIPTISDRQEGRDE